MDTKYYNSFIMQKQITELKKTKSSTLLYSTTKRPCSQRQTPPRHTRDAHRLLYFLLAHSPLGVEVPEVDALLLAAVDASDRAGDLSGHERGTTPGALVVEQNAVRQVHAVGLSGGLSFVGEAYH